MIFANYAKPFRSLTYRDIRKSDVRQQLLKMGRKKERGKLWGALTYYTWEGSRRLLNEIEGVTFVGRGEGDCVQYAIGHRDIRVMLPGIYTHSGIPEAGDLIVYGDLNRPCHVGIWQEDGSVISKWGDIGPVMRHEWSLVLPEYGKYAFFTSIKNVTISA